MYIIRNVFIPVTSVIGSTFFLYHSVFNRKADGIIYWELILGIGLIFLFLAGTEFVKKHESVWAFCVTALTTSVVNMGISITAAYYVADSILVEIGVVFMLSVAFLSMEELMILSITRLIWNKQDDAGFQKMYMEEKRQRERRLEMLLDKISDFRQSDNSAYSKFDFHEPDVEELDDYFENWRERKCS